MRMTCIGRALGAVAVLLVLSGCQLVGPTSIGFGRDRYNSILQSTSMEQTMANIVRVYEHEPTLFMDVTEVDATLSFGGSLAGGATNIGSVPGKSGATLAGRVGAASGTVQYSETPTVRYQPLLGQALVAQLVTPVSVDALGLLYDSSWPAAPLLDMASAYLTLDYDEFYSALNTIIELDDRGSIELAAAKSDLPEPEKAIKTPSTTGPAGSAAAGKPSSAGDNNSLVIYLRPYHPHATGDSVAEKRRVLQLWVRLLRIYPATQPHFTPRDGRCASLGLSAGDPVQLKDWDVNIETKPQALLDAARLCLPGHIELRVVPAPARGPSDSASGIEAADLLSRAPLMRTYSALGILKAATERPHPKIEFVTPARYQQIRDPATHGWNGDPDSASFYILLPGDQDSVDCPGARLQAGGCDNPLPAGAKGEHAKQRDEDLARWLTASAAHGPAPAGGSDPYHGLFVYEDPGQDVLGDRYVRLNQQLGVLRRYMLIVVDDRPPTETPYVEYENKGRWYYIAADDTVSKKNFHLLSLFLTMMAVPPSTQPLSPVINVGG